MSETKTRIPLAEAERLAEEVSGLIGPWCERTRIAGSIRRRRPDIGDLELVVIPRLEVSTVDLFGDVEQTTNLLDEACRRLVDAGTFAHRPDKNGRPAFGSRYKRLVYRGVGLDLFAVVPGGQAQWGVIATIRTGSAEFSHRLVTIQEQGGWMPRGCHVEGGALWRDGRIVPTPEEADLFQEIGRDWVEPWGREVRP